MTVIKPRAAQPFQRRSSSENANANSVAQHELAIQAGLAIKVANVPSAVRMVSR